eukprot:4178350-Prymnesium_polylepis.1
MRGRSHAPAQRSRHVRSRSATNERRPAALGEAECDAERPQQLEAPRPVDHLVDGGRAPPLLRRAPVCHAHAAAPPA